MKIDRRLKWNRLWLWGLFVLSCSLPFWWPWRAEASAVRQLVPLHKVINLHLFGSFAVLDDLLRYLMPMIASGAVLNLLDKRTRFYQALLLGAVLGLLLLLAVGGAFVSDALVYGAIGCGVGFAMVSIFYKGKELFTRQVSIGFGIAVYVSIALMLILGGGPRFGKLRFSSNLKLPDAVTLSCELPEDGGVVSLYSIENPNGIQTNFDMRINEVPVSYSDEQWDVIGRRELSTMEGFLPEIYELEQVQALADTYRLFYSVAVEGHPVSGYEVTLDYDMYGKPLSLFSPVTDFIKSEAVTIYTAADSLERIRRGEAGYTLLLKEQPKAIDITEAVLSYRDDANSGYLLPFWSFSGTAVLMDDSTEPFVLYAEAMK